MRVQQLVPVAAAVELQEVIDRVGDAPPGEPFSPDRVALCERLSQALIGHPQARAWPELVALGFWLRRAEVTRLARHFADLQSDDSLLVPRGLALHLPPGNVDTLSVYSWALSLLVGNRNLVRLSSRSSAVGSILAGALRDSLAEAPAGLRAGQAMLTYGHQPEPTAALSAVADVRLLWGGDRAVTTLRAFPLPPHGLDLAFPDRWSLCALDTDSWRALDAAGRQDLAERFFNDAFWFDQLGCASPRLVAWIGSPPDQREAELFDRVAEVAEARGYQLDEGVAVDKLTFAARAVLDGPVTRVARHGRVVLVLHLATLHGLSRAHVGGGVFFQASLPKLDALGPYIQRKDQTLTSFGISPATLRAFARGLRGRGLDRVVPVGRALSFGHRWDGHDLLQALCRRVVLEVAP